MEIVVMRVGKDYRVTMTELRIAGLRKFRGCYLLNFPTREMDEITQYLPKGLPVDLCLVDYERYIHFARFIFSRGKVEYVIMMTKIRRTANLKKFTIRLQQHGWRLMLRIRPLRNPIILMGKVNKTKTTFRCKCGSRLIIMEKHGALYFGCPRCDCYVVIPQWRLKEFEHGNLFNWKALMEYAYDTYIDVRAAVCR